MLFIHPMWDSENQRLGLKACTPMGYALRAIADLIGLSGLILLFATLVYLADRLRRHQFSGRDLWLLLVPFLVGIVGRVVFELSGRLAAKRQFQYDYATRTARWVEDGRARVFPNPK